MHRARQQEQVGGHMQMGGGGGGGGGVRSSGKPDNAFGGRTMPPIMLQWCKQELQKITKSDDDTLVHFCYTLDSPADIREYMRNYMGSTPQVSAFASEFIRKKKNRGGASKPKTVAEAVKPAKTSQKSGRRGRRRRR